jgi:phage shock protein E
MKKATAAHPTRRTISLMRKPASLLLALLAAAAVAGDKPVLGVTAEQVHERLTANAPKPLIVDVREPDEFSAGHIDGAVLAPLASVVERLGSVGKDREIVLVCRSGRRSANAYGILADQGYTNLRNLEGGMLAWARAGFPVVKKAE